jgi:Acyltransferase family
MSDRATGSGPRYHALDCARATAMLLGVLYHAVRAGMMRGGGWGQGGSPAGKLAALAFTEWLHSFRMPLFFVISGFFCHMMLGTHGTGRYLVKRWWRIGAPMVVALFALSLLHKGSRSETFGGRGGTRVQADGNDSASPVSLSPQLKPIDKDAGGSRSEAERKDVMATWQRHSGDDWKPAAGGTLSAPAKPIELGSPGDAGAAGFDLTRLKPRAGPVARRIFGSWTGRLNLGALWFLWYLLIFATIAPLVTGALGWLLLRPTPEAADRIGRCAIRFGVAPLALGLVSVPALMQTKGRIGWSLGMAAGIFANFPDALFQYHADMPFYFAYFLAGWWLYRLRDSLPDVACLWLPSMILGCIAFVVAGGVSAVFAAQTDLPHYGLIRLGGYAIYATGTAFLAWGFLGFFQRFVDRPTRVGRYLADTAFWVYLAHQELLQPVVGWLAPLHLYWWAQALLASVMATAAALALFEIFVRPTPLNQLFGAASPHRKQGGKALPAHPGPSDATSAAS